MLALLREPLGDLCISRPKSRLDWGIELPFDDRYVTYVWFDALLNYVSALDAAGRPELWPHAQHLIGKDILKPHAVFWPTMLMAAGLPLYRAPARARLLEDATGEDVEEPRQRRPPARRCRSATAWTRSATSCCARWRSARTRTSARTALVTRLNADLANGLGNLASRVLAMQQRYFEGAVQPLAPEARRPGAARGVRDRAPRARRSTSPQLAFHRGLEAVWRALDHANKYVTDTAPFTLAKDPAQRPRVGAILHELCEALRVTAQLRRAVPAGDGAAARRLSSGFRSRRSTELDRPWGSSFPPGHRTLPPEALFPRVEAPA